MYVYKRTETNLYTVGFYDPDGQFWPESDWSDSKEAAKRVHWLNGGDKKNFELWRYREEMPR